MGYLTTFRGLFGNVLEVFHSAKGLQPKDLLQALQTTIEDRKKVLLDGVFVPNHFTVHLSRKDMGDIRPLLRSLMDQLTVKISEWIAHKGYSTLSGTIRVEVVESPEMAEDEVYIEARMEERPVASRPDHAPAAISSSAAVPPVRAPGHGESDTTGPAARKTMLIPDRRTVLMDRTVGQLKVLSGKSTGQTFALKLGETTIGRGPGAQVVLEDEPPFVSRTHCLLRASPTQVQLLDLNSTNGILLNGEKVKEAILRHLDNMQVGSFTLQFISSLDSGLPQAAATR